MWHTFNATMIETKDKVDPERIKLQIFSTFRQNIGWLSTGKPLHEI